MQAIRPRVFTPPLQLGLAVQLHHQFGSRFLIDTLHKLGYCSSYETVKQFEHCAAIDRGVDIPHFDKDKQFVQFAADNIDHNIRTLDGHNTFHGMGMIAMVTPRINQSRQIPKITVSANDIAEIGKVNIQFCTKFTKLVGTKYEVLGPIDAIDPTFNLNILWKASMLLKPPWMAWSGMMQGVHILESTQENLKWYFYQ